MKRIYRYRMLSLFLAILMIFTALPVISVGAIESYSADDYAANVEAVAMFNTNSPYDVLLCDHPDNFNWDIVIPNADIPGDLKLVIKNYYINAEDQLFYKVEAAPGYTLPDILDKNQWIYQNNLGMDEEYDALIIVKPCDTCGKLDCESEHENWCEICMTDDCGKDHGVVDPTDPPAETTEQTLNSTVGDYTLGVTGILPNGVGLKAAELEAVVSNYIHSQLLGLDALTEDEMALAYDISLAVGENKVQPESTLTVKLDGLDTNKYTEYTVYHLPSTNIETIRKIMNGENITLDKPETITPVTVGNGYIEFETDGFSIYYIVSGSQSDSSGNDTFYILPGTSVELTGVNNTNYTVTCPDNKTADECGVSVNRSGNTLTFAATSNATLGTYTIKISTSRTATIHVLSPDDMFTIDGIDNDVYFTVIGDSTEIPNEPMSGGNYSWYYIKKNGGSYSFSSSFFTGAYQNSPDGFLKLDVIASSDALEQNLQGQNVIGVIDNGWGEDTRPCINLTNDEWHNILSQFVSGNRTVYISNGTGGKIRLTSEMVNERLEDGSYRYKMYPYVVKLIIDGGSGQDGWHVDCAIVDTKTYSVSYEYNLPSSAIIQENSDLLKPETKFYTPGTSDVKVGLMTLGKSNVTGNTSVTIYDTNTQSTSEYKFLYWNTAPDGSGTSYAPNASLPEITKSIVLYAIWNHTQTSGTVKLQKTVIFEDFNDERMDDELSYTFTVTIANAEAGKAYPYTIYNADNTIKTQNLELVSGGTVELMSGEYAIVSNVPGGLVTIEETVSTDSEFDVSWKVGSTTTEGKTVTATVTAGNQAEIVCVNTYIPLVADLTITKNGAQAIDENQSFIFTVEGMGITLDVVINGNGSVTIQDLPIGNYTVTENTNWSWRYTPADDSQTITLVANSKNEVSFANTRSRMYWLSGDSINENQYTVKPKEDEN